MAKQNIIYPEHITDAFPLPTVLRANSLGHCTNHDFLSYIYDTIGEQAVELSEGSSTLRNVCLQYLRTLAGRYRYDDLEYVLVFSCPGFLSRFFYKSQLPQWPVFLKNFFKAKSISYVLFLSDQATLIQSMYGYNSTANYPIWHLSGMMQADIDYGHLISNINQYFLTKENNIRFLSSSSKDDVHLIDEFSKFMGISIDGTFDLAPPPIQFPIKRDVLSFMDAVNRLFYSYPYSRPAPVRWTNELDFLASGTDELTLFSPEEYRYLSQKYDATNAAILKELNYPADALSLTPPDKWVPAGKLTPERTQDFLTQLSQPARESLARGMETYPEYALRHGPRVIQKALSGTIITKKPATVAVLTLTYNHEKYIEKNIQSVLEQKTDFPVEHIIVDDGSTDATRDIILRYAEKHPHITPVLQDLKWKNVQGASPRRLFEMASTEYVALCDGDDYFCDPLKLQKQYDFLRDSPRCSICFHPVFVIWEEAPERNCLFPGPRDLPPHKQPYNLTDLVKWNFMSTSSVMYRWRFREGLPYWFYETALPGDWYWHMLHAEVGRIGMLIEPMSVYRRHNSGIWKYAETDLIEHKVRNGVRELGTYIVMDRHFNGRYNKLFSERILWEFSFLYKIYTENGRSEPFENAVKMYPEWTAEVLKIIQKSKKETSQGNI